MFSLGVAVITFFFSFLSFSFFLPVLEASNVCNNNNSNKNMRLAQYESGENLYMQWVEGMGREGRRQREGEERKNRVARSLTDENAMHDTWLA